MDELEEMKAENPTAQVECHFCNKHYIFDLDDLMENIRQRIRE